MLAIGSTHHFDAVVVGVSPVVASALDYHVAIESVGVKVWIAAVVAHYLEQLLLLRS